MHDTPYHIVTHQKDHVAKYDIHRSGEDCIATVYTYGYAVRIVEALNAEYKTRVAKALLVGVPD